MLLVEKAIGNARGQLQYIANVGLKVNVKLGGVNHTVAEPYFTQKRTMLVGADVTHPSSLDIAQGKSVASFSGMVATYDPSCVQYTALGAAQVATVEMIMDFQPMMKELLKRYMEKNNGKLPERIIYFRDGVSEGQFPQVLERDLVALKGKPYSPTRPPSSSPRRKC